MKKIIIFAMLFMIAINVANVYAVDLRNWDLEISLDRGLANFEITMEYDGFIDRSDYFILTRISDVKVTADGQPTECSVSQKDLGTSILCTGIHAAKIVYKFTAFDLVDASNKFNIFRYKFPITDNTDRFSVTVKLPVGSALVDPSALAGTGLQPFEPFFGKSGSDGRSIFVVWVLGEPSVGQSLDVSVIYEQGIDINQVIVAIVAVIVIIIMIGITFFFKRSRIQSVLPVLNEGERKVMQILLREKKEIDQRKIVNETDYSKSKVSRIIQNLEDRGLVERTKKGRANKIRALHRKPETPKTEEKSKEEKSKEEQ